MGVGGVGLIVLAVCVKTLPRLVSRGGTNPNLDFSNLGAIAGSLVITLIVLVIGLTLWRVMGIARVLAAGYCLQLSVVTLMLVVGVASRKDLLNDKARQGQSVLTKADPQTAYLSSVDVVEAQRQEASSRGVERRQDVAEVALRRQPDLVQPTADAPITGLSEPREAVMPRDAVAYATTHAGALPSGDPMADRIEAFRARNSREHTVVIKITRSNESDSPRDVRLAMQKTLSLDRHFYSMFADQALLLFVHEGPISEIVGRLTAGEVISVDEAQRTIEFRINALGL